MPNESDRCFPWKADGPLCPVLQRPNVWENILGQENLRDLIRKALFKIGLKPNNEIERIRIALMPILAHSLGRRGFDKALKKIKATY